MDPRIHLQDGEVLVFLAVVFFIGFATCWFIEWRFRRTLYETMADQQRTIARLRQQATRDVTTICDLQERLDANERAAGLWRSFETMQGKN